MTTSLSHGNSRIPAAAQAEKIPALIGREKTLHEMTMKLYGRGKELEEQERKLHEDRGKLRNGVGEAMAPEIKATKLAETEIQLEQVETEVEMTEDVRELIDFIRSSKRGVVT